MSGEKTEKPTHKKLQDARKKGQVAVSKDILIFFQLLFVFSALFLLLDTFSSWFADFSKLSFLSITDLTVKNLLVVTKEAVVVTAKVIGIVFVVSMIASLLGTFVQVGFMFSPEAVKPSFKKFDVIGNFKNMFSGKSLVQLLLSVFKVIVLTVIFYFIFKFRLDEIIKTVRLDLPGLLDVLVRLLKFLIYPALLSFSLLSIMDWAAVFYFHRKNLMMSKQEVFDEYKQNEGDPHIKSQRKQTHRSLIDGSLSNMSNAKVVVANPTHISVALDYEPGTHDLPYVLCIETDEFAYLVRQQALKMGIPVIRNVELARGIYHDGAVDQYIPAAYIKLAADVFKEVIELGKLDQARRLEQSEPGDPVPPGGGASTTSGDPSNSP